MANKKRKAYLFVTRRAPAGADAPGSRELLVFQNTRLVDWARNAVGYPVLELPGGTIDRGEEPEQAVLRELREEAGDLPVNRPTLVTRYDWYNKWSDKWHDRHLFHAEAAGPIPDRFDHQVTGGGGDLGQTFRYFWIPLAEAPARLAYDFGRDLHLLPE